MIKKYKDTILICVMALFLLGMSLWCWFKETDTFSDSERRVLASFPVFSHDSISSGNFMEEFEIYTQDQFPLRDSFRSWKAFSELNIFQKSDYNGIYLENGHLSKLEYTVNEPMLTYAADCFQSIYDTYLANQDIDVFFSIVPDKNYFLAAPNGYPSMDYDQLIAVMGEKIGFMTYIDITDCLSIEDYYQTDTHWRQEKILDVAEKLMEAMKKSNNSHKTQGNSTANGADNNPNNAVNRITPYVEHTLENPFYGVYCGQSALPVSPDTITYLTSDILDSCIVTCMDSEKAVEKSLYDLEKASGKDPYEMFLSGQNAILILDNPQASTDKELILFRDSFGSSLAPLLLEEYAKITVVDLRYISSKMLGEFIEFEDQDVLFLYSTLILNNSLTLK